jgi:hypothetical protein
MFVCRGNLSSALLLPASRAGKTRLEATANADGNVGLLPSVLQFHHALLEPGHVFGQRGVARRLLAQAQENGMPLF